jgi:membrane protease YdiL (CAAX protease family)
MAFFHYKKDIMGPFPLVYWKSCNYSRFQLQMSTAKSAWLPLKLIVLIFVYDTLMPLEGTRELWVNKRGASPSRLQTYMKDRIVKGYDLNLLAVVSISTLALILGAYYPLNIGFPRATELVYYLLLPLAVGWVLFRDKPWDYGMRIGRWKSSIILTLVCLAAMSLILYAVSKMPDFRSYYHKPAIDWRDLLLYKALYYFAWEFLFRGYMLFGLERSIGKNAIFVQIIPFVLLHLDKPFLETLACVPGGFVFGYVAYGTRSFLPCFVIHLGMYMMMVSFVN